MSKKTDLENQIKHMRNLDFSEEEIENVLKADAEIDKGAKLFELTPEQEQVAKKMRNCGTRKAPTVYQLDNTGGKRNRKENTHKAQIIAEIEQFLRENAGFSVENLEILNKERQISFNSNGETYEITLIQKRKK